MSKDLKYLWAPWRMGYIKTPKNEFGPCLFCDKAIIGDDAEILGDQQYRRAGLVRRFPHLVEELGLNGDVEPAGRLVGNQQFGL